MFSPIFKPIFRPTFKSGFPSGGDIPPNSSNLISWTFTKTLDSLFSKDFVIQSEENAKFVSSYCAELVTTDSLAIVENPVAGTQALTLFGWFNPAKSAANAGQLCGFSWDGFCSLLFSTTNKFQFSLKNAAGTTITAESSAYTDNKMHFIKGTYDGANLKIYVDGVLDNANATKAQTGNIFNTTGAFAIGKIVDTSGNVSVYGMVGKVAGVGYHTAVVSDDSTLKTVAYRYFPLAGYLNCINSDTTLIQKGSSVANLFSTQDDFHFHLLNGYSLSKVNAQNGTSYGGTRFSRKKFNNFEVTTKSQLSLYYAGIPLTGLFDCVSGDYIDIRFDLEILLGTLGFMRVGLQNGLTGADSNKSIERTYSAPANGTFAIQIQCNSSSNLCPALKFEGSGGNVSIRISNIQVYHHAAITYRVYSDALETRYTNLASTLIPETNLICMGDSNTQGSPSNFMSFVGYGNLFYQGLKRFINHGVSGETITQIRSRWDAAKIPFTTGTSKVIVLAGTNDLADSATTIFANLEAFWDEIISDGFEVLAITLPWRVSSETKIKAVNALIKASSKPAKVFDIYEATTTADIPDAGMYQADNVHLSDVGQQVLANLLFDSIGRIAWPINAPAGKWHNGAETKVVVGTTGVKDATGWIAKSTFKDKAGNDYTPAEADANEIFARHTTAPAGYCKEVDMNTLPAVSSGEYVFVDNSNPVKIKNLLWYGIAPTNINSVKVKKFVNKTDFMVFDDGYFFDENDFAITYR